LLLCTQVYNGDGFAAVVFGFEGYASDQGVGFQEPGEAATEGTRAMTVDDAHTVAIGEGRFVEELVDALGGFFYGHADDVNFAGGRVFAGRGSYGDVASLPCAGNFAGGLRYDGGDLVDGNFHAQRASFDFGGGTVDAAENHGLVEAAHAKAGPG
jgi:hypothetical protein